MPTPQLSDDILCEAFLIPMRRCLEFRPAFGLGKSAAGVSLAAFQELYGSDLFYAALGLDDPLMYAAHKAAGGMTSVYRQLGVASEALFKSLLQHRLHLTADELAWSYEYQKDNGKAAIHSLDAKVTIAEVPAVKQAKVRQWIQSFESRYGRMRNAEGLVFEVRQGYKSADSKRQNADLRFGIRAYQESLIPVIVVFSSQISQPVIRRYRNDGIVVMTGTLEPSPLDSTFAFCEQVLGYDLRAFFLRCSPVLTREVRAIISYLLQPE